MIEIVVIDLRKYEHKRLINIFKYSFIIVILGGFVIDCRILILSRDKQEIGLIFKISIQSH